MRLKEFSSTCGNYKNPMQRRKVCRYFERGTCRKDDCPFIHLKEGKRQCKWFLEGNCKKGTSCQFFHGVMGEGPQPPEQESARMEILNDSSQSDREERETHPLEKTKRQNGPSGQNHALKAEPFTLDTIRVKHQYLWDKWNEINQTPLPKPVPGCQEVIADHEGLPKQDENNELVKQRHQPQSIKVTAKTDKQEAPPESSNAVEMEPMQMASLQFSLHAHHSKTFANLAKSEPSKAIIKLNEAQYFSRGYMQLMKEETDSLNKGQQKDAIQPINSVLKGNIPHSKPCKSSFRLELLQIIRRFQDTFHQYCLENQSRKQFSRIYEQDLIPIGEPLGAAKYLILGVRPLLFSKDWKTHFELKENWLWLSLELVSVLTPEEIVNGSKPEQVEGQLRIGAVLNKSVPESFRRSLIDTVRRSISARATTFEKLKYIQNSFEAIYERTFFRMESQYYNDVKRLQQAGEGQRKSEEDKRIAKASAEVKKSLGAVQSPVRIITQKQKLNSLPQLQLIPIALKDGEKFPSIGLNYLLKLQSLVLIGCPYALVESVLLYLECGCGKPVEYLLHARGLKQFTIGAKLKCRKCMEELCIVFERQLLQVKDNVAGRLSLDNGIIMEAAAVSFKIGCSCDLEIPREELIVPTQRLSFSCHQCFQALQLSFSGIKCPNPYLKTFTMDSGKELPLKGNCKHSRLTFRWLRFQCCGRTVTCRQCHSELPLPAPGHREGPTLTFICGFCSHQQPFGGKGGEQCEKCEKILVKGIDKTGHWEGGLGCRDQAQISKKDNKKYTGLTKKNQSNQPKEG